MGKYKFAVGDKVVVTRKTRPEDISEDDWNRILKLRRKGVITGVGDYDDFTYCDFTYCVGERTSGRELALFRTHELERDVV